MRLLLVQDLLHRAVQHHQALLLGCRGTCGPALDKRRALLPVIADLCHEAVGRCSGALLRGALLPQQELPHQVVRHIAAIVQQCTQPLVARQQGRQRRKAALRRLGQWARELAQQHTEAMLQRRAVDIVGGVSSIVGQL